MPASDDIHRWSAELAGDPASRVFLPLGEALRVRGQLDLARRVAVRGLERHPEDADAHDLLARLHADRGDTEGAIDEWSAALRYAPGHVGALKGMGFVCYRQGKLAEAESYLAQAAAADHEDERIGAALARVRAALAAPPSRPSPSPSPSSAPSPSPSAGPVRPDAATPALARPLADRDPIYLFADLTGGGEQAALLLDRDGLVLAGAYVVSGGVDVGQEIGAALTGISDEARRAMRHLGLGDWSSIVFESDAARVAMAPAPDDGIALVAAAPGLPSGLVRRVVERVVERARQWLGVTA
jgi:tetratricopeptide (TPR) repeat protein